MRRIGPQTWDEIHEGNMAVETDGWVINLYKHCDNLGYCESCFSPDDRSGSFEHWQRYSVDPVELLSTWEYRQLEDSLKAL
jgi:hypothetical protein